MVQKTLPLIPTIDDNYFFILILFGNFGKGRKSESYGKAAALSDMSAGSRLFLQVSQAPL